MRRGWWMALWGPLAAACTSGPPAAARLISAREIGLVEQPAAIQGRDGGESARLWDRAVFAYGDTVLNLPDTDGQTWHHNSYAITGDLDAADGIAGLASPLDEAGAPAYFLAPTVDEAAYNEAHRGDPCAESPCGARLAVWPGAPVWDEAAGRALIPYELVAAAPGAFNFHGVGDSFAVWRAIDQAPERPEVAPGDPHPTLLWRDGEPAPGLAPQLVGAELQAFAHTDDGCLLFAAPLEGVLERAAWRAWDGAGWNADLEKAKPLFDGAPILSVAWNDFLGAYVAVYAPPLVNQVVLRTAPALTGPWSEPLLLFDTDPGASDSWTYDAVGHAEYDEDGGRVLYVTYSRPTGETWFSSVFPLVRVELDRR